MKIGKLHQIFNWFMLSQRHAQFPEYSACAITLQYSTEIIKRCCSTIVCSKFLYFSNRQGFWATMYTKQNKPRLEDTVLTMQPACEKQATVSLSGAEFLQYFHLTFSFPSRFFKFGPLLKSSISTDMLLRLSTFLCHINLMYSLQKLKSYFLNGLYDCAQWFSE